jgi:hypothetical protein
MFIENLVFVRPARQKLDQKICFAGEKAFFEKEVYHV